MQQRPTSLTIIGWLFIVFGAFGLIGQAMMRSNPIALEMLKQSPLPASIHLAVGVIGALVAFASGYGVLKGMNWSRFLYAGWSLFGSVFAFATMPFSSLTVLGWVCYAAILFFLFRPTANRWFGQNVVAV